MCSRAAGSACSPVLLWCRPRTQRQSLAPCPPPACVPHIAVNKPLSAVCSNPCPPAVAKSHSVTSPALDERTPEERPERHSPSVSGRAGQKAKASLQDSGPRPFYGMDGPLCAVSFSTVTRGHSPARGGSLHASQVLCCTLGAAVTYRPVKKAFQNSLSS